MAIAVPHISVPSIKGAASSTVKVPKSTVGPVKPATIKSTTGSVIHLPTPMVKFGAQMKVSTTQPKKVTLKIPAIRAAMASLSKNSGIIAEKGVAKP